MAWVALFVFLGKLASAAKEMAVAYRYGVSAEVDAYLFVWNILFWPVVVWGSLLPTVLVPLAARIRHDFAMDLPRFRAELFGLAFLVGLILAILAWLGLPALLGAPWTGLQSTTAAIAIEMVPTLVMLVPIGMVTTLFCGWMLAAGRPAINNGLEAVPALSIAIAVIAFSSGGIEPLVWGTVAGFVLHMISLATALYSSGELEAPRFTRQSPHWSSFWKGFSIMLAAQGLMSFVGIIDQFFAAHLGTGAVATLSYANRILALLLGLGGAAVAQATLPIFSKTAAEGGKHGQRVASHWVRLLFLLGVIYLIAGWWLAPWAVGILFERGAFTPEDTLAVTGVLRYGLVQLPFYFAALVLVSYASSQRRYSLLFWSGVIALGSKVIGNIVLIPLFGINGIAMAWTLVCAINALFFWFAIGRSL